MLTYFSIKTELTDAIDMMTDEGAGKLLKALMHYARGEKTEVNGEARLMFAVAKMTIDANASAAADKSDRARAAVTARWHKEEEQPEKKPEQKPKRTVQRFQPPTVQEVAAYCAERKNSVNAQQFVDFYAAKGWKVGTTAMKDWKACVRTW